MLLDCAKLTRRPPQTLPFAMISLAIEPPNSKWTDLSSHRVWLLREAEALFSFFEGQVINPLGGFHDLDDEGRPTAPGYGAAGKPARYLFSTTRIIHAFSIAHLMGRPGADVIINHGMEFLWNSHRDPEYGGYYWGVGYDAPSDSTKQAYGHAFVLLASSSAKAAGHPDADRLLADISTIIWERFWEEQFGAVAEEFTRDWQSYDTYRGQNSNMHLTESLMAAFEATNDSTYIRMAERIAELIVRRHAAGNGWRLPEHFTKEWRDKSDLCRQPHVSPLWNHARPLARVVAPTAPVMGTRRPQTGLASPVLEGVIRPSSGGRVGQREGWFLLYARLGRQAANTRSLLVAVLRRDRSERFS